MKKVAIILFLLCFTMPVYAGFWDKLDSFLTVPTPQEQFNNLEKQVKEDTYKDLQIKLENFWNLKGQLFENPEFKKQMSGIDVKTFPDTFIVDKEGINEYYEMFKKNKNNMGQNRALYESINEDFINIYSAFEKLFTEEIYKSEFYQYQKKLYERNKNIQVNPVHIGSHKYNFIYDYQGTNSTTGQEIYKLRGSANDIGVKVLENWQQYKKGFLEQEQPILKNILSVIDENIRNAQKVQDEIKNYSIAYEQKKLENYYKSRYGNIKNCGDISDVIMKGTTPQNSCYYDANPLQVLQVTNGGILARDYDWDSNRIFILTNKKYVDGDNYRGRLLYKGIYKYTSIMGAPVTVRKFQEITIPNDTFYFIDK